MGCFLRVSSLCELECWLPYNHGAVELWVFPVLEAGMFLTATIQLQAASKWMGHNHRFGMFFWALPAIMPVTHGHFGHLFFWPLFPCPGPLFPGDKDVETTG